MKNLNQTFALALTMLTGLLFIGCSSDKKQNEDTDFNADLGFRTIVLQVNTAEIKPGPNADEYISFANQPAGVSDEDFLTGVALGDKIMWVGVSTSNPFDHKVNIMQINHHGQDNVLDQNTIRAKNGVVVAEVKSEGVEGETEKYFIHFKIDSGGNGNGPTYPIDPKLKIMN